MTPLSPPRVTACGYVRVSKERSGQISPAVQREAILEDAEKRGWIIERFFEDIDRSASKNRPMELPGFAAMVSFVQTGGAQAIIFYRVDRAVREFSGEFDVIQGELERSGVRIAFTNRQYDDTPEGTFALDLDKALSRLEVRRLGDRLKKMHRTLAHQGKHPGNQPPFGWRRVRDEDGQQRLVLVPDEAEWRRRMHEWFQVGWPLREIARELNRQGVPTRRGAAWQSASVRSMLTRPMQTGARVFAGEVFRTGRIEPLIDQETFERTMALIEARRNGPLPGRPSERPIPAGLLICGTCGGRMYAHVTARSSPEGAVPYYCCGNRTRGGLCERGVHVRESVLRAEVEPLLIKRLRRVALGSGRRESVPDLAPLRAEQEVLEISLARLTTLYTEGELSRERYERAAAMEERKLQRVRERIERAIGEVEARALRSSLGTAGVTPALWERLPVETKQGLYQLAISRIIVNPRPTERRIEVVWR